MIFCSKQRPQKGGASPRARRAAGMAPVLAAATSLAACTMLFACMQGCGAAASPHWAGARPDEAPAAADTTKASVVAPPQAVPGTVPPGTSPPATTPPVAVPPETRTSPPGNVPPGVAETVVEVPQLAPQSGSGYIIGPGDELSIVLPYDRDLNTSALVRPDGMITASSVGEVRAAGRSVAELDSVLLAEYGKIYRYPAVTVGVTKLANNVVYIMGEAVVPGPVDLNGPMSLLQLLARAGGARTTAQLKSVLLLHRGVGNQVIVRRVNVARMLQGRRDSPDIMLNPTDIVYVPQTFIAKLDVFAQSVISTIVDNSFAAYIKGWQIAQPNRFFYNPNPAPTQVPGTGTQR